jgi:protein tyrosine/serine phosphatase
MHRHVTKERAGSLSVVMFALLLCAPAAPAQTQIAYPELPNFHQVNSQLYRGAQPLEGGIQRLKQLGIKTIINLRGEDEETHAERSEAEALGLHYQSIPLPGFSRPPSEKVERALEIINNPAYQPVFVHCHHGKDRTGVVIAAYRITHDGCPSKAAKAEAKRYGMSFLQIEMKDFISDYYRDWKRLHPESGACTISLTASLAPG